jgi:hypothetical protein
MNYLPALRMQADTDEQPITLLVDLAHPERRSGFARKVPARPKAQPSRRFMLGRHKNLAQSIKRL